MKFVNASAAGDGVRIAPEFARPALFWFLTLLLVPFQAGVVYAGQNTWTSHGPDGGNVATIAIDRTNPQTL